MTTVEFSSEFDILYNNIMSNKAPGLDGYEKSVFLTKAQLEIVMGHFNPKGNKYQEGVDGNPKRQIEFSELISYDNPQVLSTATSFDRRGIVFALPQNTLLLLNESFSWTIGGKVLDYQVLPISFDEYFRLMSKPYKAPMKNQVWRLAKDKGTLNSLNISDIQIEIIPHRKKDEGSSISYSIRYVRKPIPIILEDLADMQLTIDGESGITDCELNPMVHREILDRAVELAKAAYIGNLESTVQLNTRNE